MQVRGCFISGGVLHTFRTLSLGECRYHSFVFSSIVARAPGSILTPNMKPFVEKGHSFVHMKRDEGMEPFFENLTDVLMPARARVMHMNLTSGIA
ncbi:MAG: hypothetical protein ACLTDF_00050 [Coprococcus sp.]